MRSHYLQGGEGSGSGFGPVSGLDPGSQPRREDGGRFSLSSKSGLSSSARYQKSSSFQLAILKVWFLLHYTLKHCPVDQINFYYFSLRFYFFFYFSQLNELLIWLNESRGRAKLKERLRIIDPSALFFQKIAWFQILML